MRDRVYGLETEYLLRFLPRGAASPPPAAIHEAVLGAVAARWATVPARGRKGGLFHQNGSYLHVDAQAHPDAHGVLEWATPECRTPRDLTAAAVAQDQMLMAACPVAEARLRQAGWDGTLLLGKNNLDVAGRTVGSHENYLVEDRPGRAREGLRAAGFLPFYAALQVLQGVYVLLAIVLVLAVLCGHAAAVGARLVARLPGLRGGTLSGLRPGGPDLERLLLAVLDRALHHVLRPLVRAWSVCLRATTFTALRGPLAAHLATRIVFAGAGRLALDSPGCVAGFQLSQRADLCRGVMRIHWDEAARPLLDLKPFLLQPFSVFARRKRLHVVAGDANLCETAQFLRVGTTGLVVRLCEEGHASGLPRLADPSGAMRTISRDPSLRVPVALQGGGRATALEIQRRLLEACATAFGQEEGATAEVLRRWRQVLDRLARDPASTRGQVDWVTKRELLLHAAGGEAGLAEVIRLRPLRAALGAAFDALPEDADGPTLREAMRAGTSAAGVARIEALVGENFEGFAAVARAVAAQWRLRKADLRYHHLDPAGGYFYRLQTAGTVARLLDERQIARAMADPPRDTRAAARGRLVRRMAAARWLGTADWGRVVIRDLRRTVHLTDPLDPATAVVDAIVASGDGEAAVEGPRARQTGRTEA